jgi:hypothetical protein
MLPSRLWCTGDLFSWVKASKYAGADTVAGQACDLWVLDVPGKVSRSHRSPHRYTQRPLQDRYWIPAVLESLVYRL